MPLTPVKRFLYWFAAIVTAVISGLWLVVAFRYVAIPVYLVMVAVLLAAAHRKRFHPALVAVVCFILATLSPVDITVPNFDRAPRVVPYVTGLPTPETFQKAARGEVVLAYCIVSGFEPRWVLVW